MIDQDKPKPAVIRTVPGHRELTQEQQEQIAKAMDLAFKEEEAMEQTDKPRICEVLGVEVGERFIYPGMTGEFYITENGTLISVDDGSEHPMMCASTLINCRDRIIRKTSFTPEEVAFLRHVESIFPGSSVKKIGDSALIIEANKRGKWALPAELLPSLRHGWSVPLTDLC